MITREQLFKLGMGARILHNVMKEINMEKHLAVAMTPQLISAIRFADMSMMYERDFKDGELGSDKFVGVPVVMLKTNGDL